MARRRKQRANPPVRPQQQLAAHRLQITESYSGPLPHPNILRQYEELMPGLADRIITMAENQANHRIDIEAYAIPTDARRANVGVAAGLIVFLGFVVGSVYLIDRGHSNEGLVVGLGALASLVSAFAYGTLSRRKEREHRIDALSGQQRG
jgi:uncharacterized membrane protein